MFGKRKKALILLNTSSGTGRAASMTLEIIKRLAQRGYEPILYPIIPKSDLVSEKILPEYEDQLDMVVCSGGDGTLNHVVQSIMQMKNRPLLSYIPTGSTNDFAKGLSIPVDFDKALDMIFNGNRFQYDIGKFNGSYFNYVAAFGAFSAVSYATDQQLKNLLGHAAYILSAIGDFPEHLSYTCHMRIETDNEVTEGDYIFGAICSAVSVGGFPIFKDANVKLNDGKMELLLIIFISEHLYREGGVAGGHLLHNTQSVEICNCKDAVVRQLARSADYRLSVRFGDYVYLECYKA